MGQCYLAGAGAISPAGGTLYGPLVFKNKNDLNTSITLNMSTGQALDIIHNYKDGERDFFKLLFWHGGSVVDRPKGQFSLYRHNTNTDKYSRTYNLIEFGGAASDKISDDHIALYQSASMLSHSIVKSTINPRIQLAVVDQYVNTVENNKTVSPTTHGVGYLYKVAKVEIGKEGTRTYTDNGVRLRDVHKPLTAEEAKKGVKEEYLEIVLRDELARKGDITGCLALFKASNDTNKQKTYYILHTGNCHNHCLSLSGGTVNGTIKFVSGYGSVGGDANHANLFALNKIEPNKQRGLLVLNSVYEYAKQIKDALVLRDITGKDSNNNPIIQDYKIYGSHNKTSDTYTGNGTKGRQVDTKGVGNVLLIRAPNYLGFATSFGTIMFSIGASQGANGGHNDDYYWYSPDIANFSNGILTLNTTHYALNYSGYEYQYQVL